MMTLDMDGPVMIENGSLDTIVRVIQSSPTPSFLSAVASLLGVFTTRLTGIADQVKALAEEVTQDEGGSRRFAGISYIAGEPWHPCRCGDTGPTRGL